MLYRLLIASAVGLVVGGLLAVVVGSSTLVLNWYAGRSWAASDEAERATHELAAEAPQWVDGPADAAPASSQAASESAASAQADPAQGVAQASAPRPANQPSASDGRRAPSDAVQLLDSDFRFIDPPEPGARARITVTVRNRDDAPTNPVQLVLPTPWLDGWQVIEADPPVLEDRQVTDKERVFIYPGLAPRAERALVLGLVAKDEAVDPPDLKLAVEAGPEPSEQIGQEVGQARPRTVAPRPRPGPARMVEIPRLKLRSVVVSTTWEPPAWVVGQISNTANLSEGNTILIGHLNGLVGNVFSDLKRLLPGDEVIATSRGLDYRFVVSEVVELPGNASQPMEPSDQPRLTLMTCAGTWDPIRQDYSHRLWVIAEPPELAQSTLTGGPGPLERQFGKALVAPTPAPSPVATAPVEAAPAATPTVAPVAAAPPTVAPVAAAPPPPPAPPLVIAPPAPAPEEAVEAAPPPPPTVLIREPAEGAGVARRVVVRGTRTEQADPSQPLWLVVLADVKGSRWYVYGEPLAVKPDGSWEANLELGGGAGIRHTILVAPVDGPTDDVLRRHVAEHPGEPLADLPEAFEGAAWVTVERK
jgi:sortase (surface protein transpeptidase)